MEWVKIIKEKGSSIKGEGFHKTIDGKFYCMAPPNYKCGRSVKDVGKFTEGKKKILYCKNHQYPCTKCKNKKE
jgi:hypothetical protein